MAQPSLALVGIPNARRCLLALRTANAALVEGAMRRWVAVARVRNDHSKVMYTQRFFTRRGAERYTRRVGEGVTYVWTVQREYR